MPQPSNPRTYPREPAHICGSGQYGDFEIIGDPPRRGSGPAVDPLVATNDPTGKLNLQNIVVHRLNRVTGLRTRDSRVVAENYYGCFGINGPEWVVPGSLVNASDGQPIDLGLIYRGATTCDSTGVHAVLRRSDAGPLDFDQEVNTDGSVDLIANVL